MTDAHSARRWLLEAMKAEAGPATGHDSSTNGLINASKAM